MGIVPRVVIWTAVVALPLGVVLGSYAMGTQPRPDVPAEVRIGGGAAGGDSPGDLAPSPAADAGPARAENPPPAQQTPMQQVVPPAPPVNDDDGPGDDGADDGGADDG